MSQPDRTSQEPLTPDERRTILRAFADRMLLKTAAMDDPEDMPGVERAVRVMAVIERVYSRCDRSEAQTPDPRKLEAERARHTAAAITARVHLAQDLQWGEKRRRDLGKWWDAAETKTNAQTQVLAAEPGLPQAATDAPASAAVPVAATIATPSTYPQEQTPAALKAIYASRLAATARFADLGLNDAHEPLATGGSDPPP